MIAARATGQDRASVVGAGPAGLAAAIALARSGARVTVYDERPAAGGRFHGDFQALENWTRGEDVLAWLGRLGIAADFAYRPMPGITFVDPALERYTVATDRPLFYVLKRGPEENSLDRALARQAAALGVELRFGHRVRPEELPGTVIVATGPSSTEGVVAGMIASTALPDQIVAIASDAVAPKGYAYCVVWSGRATLATVLLRDFSRAWPCFRAARDAFASLGLSDFREMRRFGGRAHIAAADRLVDGPRLYVGEAAGLQDCLFGFGLRYALLSGHLAARAIVSGESYERLVARQLRPALRAGLVNRFLYDRLGDRGYPWLIRWLARRGDVRRRARRLYAFTALSRLLWPLARLAWSRRGRAVEGVGGEWRTASREWDTTHSQGASLRVDRRPSG